MLTIVTAILGATLLAFLATTASYVLSWANRAFHVEIDPKIEAILDALPGANCGGCGFVGCAEYAEAVAKGEADVTRCAPGGAIAAQALAEIMGIAVSETFSYRAVVHCAASEDQRLQPVDYDGEPTCRAANLVAGVEGCAYGCLGFGDCVRACQYDAIHVIRGLAVVDYEKCTGCGACVRACPRSIISMVPFKSDRMLVVACSDKDFGLDVKSVCAVGCIACKACARESDLIEMDGNLPVIDYDRYDPQADFGPALEKCPAEVLVFVGRPVERDLAVEPDERIVEGKRGRESFAGTALRVLSTNDSRPLFP
jgi:RnfABCDGE-type electron transport complex B subunit